jgi:hypothetical protein
MGAWISTEDFDDLENTLIKNKENKKDISYQINNINQINNKIKKIELIILNLENRILNLENNNNLNNNLVD